MDESNFLPDVKLCRAMRVGLSSLQNRATVERINTSETFDKRGFSGTVFAQQSQNFSGVNVEADIFQRAGAAKAFHDVIKADERCCLVLAQAGTSEKLRYRYHKRNCRFSAMAMLRQIQPEVLPSRAANLP